MKKIISICAVILSLALLITIFAACGKKEGEDTTTTTAAAVATGEYSLEVATDKAIVKKGDYTPIEDVTVGLICDLNAMGKNNNDDDVTTWVDATGNGHNGKLVNFNFGTNGFINDELVCDNNAYVVIEWSPWKDNALTGSTIDLIYTPINTGVEEARVIDYTEITNSASSDEIKPFKGLFADILRTIPASASSGTSAGKVNLDDIKLVKFQVEGFENGKIPCIRH